ncbi:N-formylglutamate amidohydrolase [Frondihabitans australicus]|uniref:N-formylglutamate amidohydrolase n=1 Tax=Frondihabitans australicus TaxID=386892 RepID=A0A495IKS1_9MICO|nr:N-formylglutamate amidohydrolase [Frondihabitans australicus]RKR76379.1 N-formylglutamate amidohydrolase [Frondihabitans australicus]
MSDGARVLIPAGTTFTSDDITFWKGKADGGRTLDDAIAAADLLVSCPHAGAAIPEELDRFLAPEFTRRLQYDFTDVSTSAVVRRWAEIDERIVAVENPHPRMIRDPNRAKPADLTADLRKAFARVEKAGRGVKTDLTGVDAIRPVTFSFYPLITPPTDEAGLQELADTFSTTADRGLGVYERTRDELIERFPQAALDAAARGGESRTFTTLSFHDTMNHTTRVDGAIDVDRDPADRLPAVVALSNRGDAEGERRGDNVVTMDPARLRRLAGAHRRAFGAAFDEPDDAVQLNVPYLGSQEIIQAGARFDAVREQRQPQEPATAHGAPDLALDAVQSEFLREFLLGPENTSVLTQPGEGWITPDDARVDAIAQACRSAWDAYREGA